MNNALLQKPPTTTSPYKNTNYETNGSMRLPNIGT